MSRKKTPNCQIESSEEINSNEEVLSDGEDNIDVLKANLSFTPTFSKLNIKSEESPASPGDTMVLDSEEEDGGEKGNSLTQLDVSFNSSAE